MFRSWWITHRVNAAVRAIREVALAKLGSLGSDGGDEHSGEREDATVRNKQAGLKGLACRLDGLRP